MKLLKFWVQKVLPLVYDDSLSYYELLNKVVFKLNELIKGFNGLEETLNELVNGDITNVVSEILTEMINDGSFEDILDRVINETIFEELNDKIDNAVSEINLPQNMPAPNYVGDYLALSARYLPSAVVKHGDYIYAFDAVKESYGIDNRTDIGRVSIYSLSGNNLVRTADLNVGHCNSVAYDPKLQRFIIAPVFTYLNGQRDRNNTLITYTEDFSSMGSISMPTNIMGVSYDPVKENLYALGYDNNVYKFNYGTALFELYCGIDFNNIASSFSGTQTYNQDFAVYNDQFYISAPRGNVLTGMLTERTSVIKYGFNVGHACSNNNYYLGELEGFEFDENGHLFASMYTTLTGSLYNAFIVELQVGFTPPYIPDQAGVYAVNNETYTLSNNTNLRQEVYQIRSINQVHMMNIKPTRVMIPAGTVIKEPAPVIVFEGYMLTIEGRLEVPAFTVDGARLNVYASANGVHELKIDNGNGFYLSRNGDLKLTGTTGYNLNLELPNNKAITLDTSFPQTTVRNVPVSADYDTLLIGGQTLRRGIFFGEQLAIEFNF